MQPTMQHAEVGGACLFWQHMRKNQYEEALFRCEDDRFELDMTIESNSSAIRAITPLVQARRACMHPPHPVPSCSLYFWLILYIDNTQVKELVHVSYHSKCMLHSDCGGLPMVAGLCEVQSCTSRSHCVPSVQDASPVGRSID